MANVKYETEINAPVEKVFEYYTNPDNIKEAWPRDIVKESESLSGSKSEEGSEMKVKGEYMGKEEEMILEVKSKEQNRTVVTRQTEGPFKKWKVFRNSKEMEIVHILGIQLTMNYRQLEKLQICFLVVKQTIK